MAYYTARFVCYHIRGWSSIISGVDLRAYQGLICWHIRGWFAGISVVDLLAYKWVICWHITGWSADPVTTLLYQTSLWAQTLRKIKRKRQANKQWITVLLILLFLLLCMFFAYWPILFVVLRFYVCLFCLIGLLVCLFGNLPPTF